MSTVIQTILGRRSVRDGYISKSIPHDVIDRIVQCGLAAPSSKNAQPWRLHVVTDRTLLNRIADLVAGSAEREDYVPFDPETGRPRKEWTSTVLESANILRQVPTAIFIENRGVFSRGRTCLIQADRKALAASIVGYTFEILGIGTSLQNLWLAAIAEGLSAVFMGDVLIAETDIKTVLGFEEDLIGVLALGYAKPRPQPPESPAGTRTKDLVSWHLQR